MSEDINVTDGTVLECLNNKVDLDGGNYVGSPLEQYIHEHCGGGGLEIGDIGIAPLGIDETQNKRRYINGQLIIQDQFVSFTTKVKKAVELYPNLFCTEEQWQATVTMSTFGQCGKFVIDDEAGTIRLPKITGFIQGLTDLASLGELVEAGLPTLTTNSTGAHTHTRGTMNIAGSVHGVYISDGVSTSGALSVTQGTDQTNGSGSSSWNYSKISLDASKNWTGATSSNGAHTHTISGTADTVQPEAIRYPYFIQVATGTEETVDVTREIELNNPFFFGYYQYFEVAPNNISWLKSEGQWNSKTVYTDYYDWILTNTNNGVENFKLSTDTYDDYCWVINTADETFRLPLNTNNLNNSVHALNLYFYVGETTQNANLINAGRIEEIKANKTDIDGVWVEKYAQVTNVTAVGTYEYELPLPNDNNNYEVLMHCTATRNTNTAVSTVVYMSSIIKEMGATVRFNDKNTSDVGWMLLPVGRDHKIKVQITGANLNSNLSYIFGYRKTR